MAEARPARPRSAIPAPAGVLSAPACGRFDLSRSAPSSSTPPTRSGSIATTRAPTSRWCSCTASSATRSAPGRRRRAQHLRSAQRQSGRRAEAWTSSPSATPRTCSQRARSSIQEAANSLHGRLQLERVLDYPAVVFVAHSMGGLVVLRELLTHREDLLPRVRGLVFYATPQEGIADQPHRPARGQQPGDRRDAARRSEPRAAAARQPVEGAAGPAAGPLRLREAADPRRDDRADDERDALLRRHADRRSTPTTSTSSSPIGPATTR